MNKSHLIITLACLGLQSLTLQAAPPTPWETALAVREQRAKQLVSEIKDLDSRVEGRVERIVEVLKGVADSKDSRTKVARMKETSITALSKNMQFYQTRRASLLEELRRPTLNLTPEQKRRGITVFDQRMEKRVAQILDLQKSLPTHQDYDRYNVVDDGWYGTSYVANEDFKQNQRLSSHTNKQRKEILTGLDASIARLQKQSVTLQAQVTSSTDPATKKIFTDELQNTNTLIKSRQMQRTEVLTAPPLPTTAVGQKAALDLDKSLQSAISELRRDFATLFQRYSELLPVLSSVNDAKAAVAKQGS